MSAVVVEALADVVRPLFGPRGRDVLVVSGAHRERALVTNSGSLVLSTLLGGGDGTGSNASIRASSVDNAIGRYLLKHVAQQDGECGDACSAPFFMSEAALERRAPSVPLE